MIQNPNPKTFFLGIGAQKSGTSWLSNYLKSHPDVMMSPIKEMHFFGNRIKPNINFLEQKLAFQDVETAFTGRENKKRVRLLKHRISIQGDIEAYKRYFSSMLKTEKVYGEISPSYAYMDESEFIEIRENFPECKIIFLMRNPVDRAWSQMRFSHFKDTIEELHEKALRRMKKPAYILRCDYKSTIENLTSVFPRNQIYFGFFEHLFRQDTVDDICDFLGVAHRNASLKKRMNVSAKQAFPNALRVEMGKILQPQYAYVHRFFEGDIPDKWLGDMRAMT